VSDRFDELVDGHGLRPGERERLRRVHDLLLEVGAPPEAPPSLREAPEPPSPAQVVPYRRRRAPLLVAAALGLAAAGGAGYVLGERASSSESVPPATTTATTTAPGTTTVTAVTTAPAPGGRTVVAMSGVGAAASASATVELLPRASSGDYPIRIQLRGLPARETFELWVVDDGELDQLCGRFTTTEGLTDTVVAVPYRMRTRDDWVVVRPGTTEPLLRT
jgi:hypothetical protein